MKQDQLIKKILKRIKTGVADSKIFSDIVSIPVNIEHEFIENDTILAIKNVPITKAGVQQYYFNGDVINVLKPEEEIAKISSDYAPVSISHPSIQFSDMTEDEARERLVGYSINGYTENNKRYTDLHFFVDKLKNISEGIKILRNVANNLSIDVSIGFKTDDVMEKGTYDGVSYDMKQTNIQLDHTAALPNEQGRWSISNGVGIGADSNDQINIKLEEIKMDDEVKKVFNDKISDLEKVKADQVEEIKTLKTKNDELEAENAKLKEEKETLENEKKLAEEAKVAEEAKATEEELVKELEEVPEEAKDFKEKILAMDDKKNAIEIVKSYKDSMPKTKLADKAGTGATKGNNDSKAIDRSNLYFKNKNKE